MRIKTATLSRWKKMMRRVAYALALGAFAGLIVWLTAPMCNTQTAEVSTGMASLRELNEKLAMSSVRRATFLFMPYEVNMAVRITPTPTLLGRVADFKLDLELTQSQVEHLRVAIHETRLSKLKYEGDLRWGAIFFDNSGRQVHSVYLNGWAFMMGAGRKGFVDGAAVGLNGSLASWFEGNLCTDVSSRLRPGCHQFRQ
jgi:hypothetical protein